MVSRFMPPVPVPVSGIKGNASGPVVLEALDKDFSCLPINVLPRGLDFPSKMKLGILILSKLSSGELAPTSREEAELGSEISIQQSSSSSSSIFYVGRGLCLHSCCHAATHQMF